MKQIRSGPRFPLLAEKHLVFSVKHELAGSCLFGGATDRVRILQVTKGEHLLALGLPRREEDVLKVRVRTKKVTHLEKIASCY